MNLLLPQNFVLFFLVAIISDDLPTFLSPSAANTVCGALRKLHWWLSPGPSHLATGESTNFAGNWDQAQTRPNDISVTVFPCTIHLAMKTCPVQKQQQQTKTNRAFLDDF